MSIKKYNIYYICRQHSQQQNKKGSNTGNNRFFSKKGLLYFLAIISILTGIKIFSAIPGSQARLPVSEENHEDTPFQISEEGSDDERHLIAESGSEPEKEGLARQPEESWDDSCVCEDTVAQERLDIERLNLRYQTAQSEIDIKKVSGMLNPGETLYDYLIKVGIEPAEIIRLGEKIESVVDISRLNVGTRFTVHYDKEGKIVQFDYKPNELDAYYIKIPYSELAHIEVNKEEIFREIVCIEGEIKNSLYQAMMEHCKSSQLAVQLAEIFAWDIDFLTECQKGDTFKILVERLYRGDFYRWGDILAAVYEGELLSTHTAVLFQDHTGSTSYYDKDGCCLRKAFLRAPLNYKYISSHFTESRYHPILRIYRPHLAIDYAAPTGTPVVSIGAGTVTSRYYDGGGYGNYVEIKHPNGYTTGYGHLSKFADGLKVGKRVEQGEVIGYVGATGLATGPHLDFSISKNGKKVNFLELEIPPASSVSQEYWDDFELVKKNYLSILKEEI